MKKNFLLLGLAAVFALASCGGAKDTKTEEGKVVCEGKNAIAITIQDYYMGMSDTLVFTTPNFDVKYTEYVWINDSSLTLKMCNYEPKDLSGERKESQIDLNVELKGTHGKKIEPGFYGYYAYESGLSCAVTMTTAYGRVYFNGSDQGGITLEYADKDAICGTFSLNVEKPNSSSYGIVRTNGTFVYKR